LFFLLFFFFFLLFPSLFNLCPYHYLSQKWWSTVLETKNTCSQWVGWSMPSRCLDFFPFKFCLGWGWWWKDFFSFFFCSLYVPFKFSVGSHQVPNMCPKFPMCSQSATVMPTKVSSVVSSPLK
jgi:hypothetical protein